MKNNISILFILLLFSCKKKEVEVTNTTQDQYTGTYSTMCIYHGPEMINDSTWIWASDTSQTTLKVTKYGSIPTNILHIHNPQFIYNGKNTYIATTNASGLVKSYEGGPGTYSFLGNLEGDSLYLNWSTGSLTGSYFEYKGKKE